MISTATIAAGVDFGDSALAGCVRERMSRIEDLIRSQLDHDVAGLSEAALRPFGPERRRIRPLMTVLCAQLGDKPDAWKVTAAGAATEMVYMATLHHDGVEDADEQVGCRSDDRWRNNLAILAGDYLLASASQVLSRLGPGAVATIAETFAQMMEGQMRIHSPSDGRDFGDEALRAVAAKTGSLITTAGRLGAVFGGVARQDVDRITKLSGTIGFALQISDDIQELTGAAVPPETSPETSPETTVDLSKLFYTLPAVYALQESGPRAARLRKLLRNAVDRDSRCEAVSLIRASGGVTKAIDVCTRYAADADTELRRLPDGPERYALVQLVEYVRKRCA